MPIPIPTAPLPALRCPDCGECDQPRVIRGSGLHMAGAECLYCCRFLGWLPRRLFQPPAKAQASASERPE